MPGKGKLSAKRDRQVQHIVDSEVKSGKSKSEAKRIAYSTVNKQLSKKKG